MSDGHDEPPDLSRVELYVVPCGGPPRSLSIITELPAVRIVQVLTAGYDDMLPLLREGSPCTTAGACTTRARPSTRWPSC